VATVLAHVTTFTIAGLDPRRVTVEVDLRAGLPNFTIVGLGDRAVREARERVHAAILNSGFEFPARRLTVNLAPASLRKAGPHFDLAIALGILAASRQVPLDPLQQLAVFGELSLGGELRPCRGALSAAEGAARWGLERLLVPVERLAEAALVDGRFSAHGAWARPRRCCAASSTRWRRFTGKSCRGRPTARSTSPTSAATPTSSAR
jgi:magnesium chelatase family protein